MECSEDELEREEEEKIKIETLVKEEIEEFGQFVCPDVKREPEDLPASESVSIKQEPCVKTDPDNSDNWAPSGNTEQHQTPPGVGADFGSVDNSTEQHQRDMRSDFQRFTLSGMSQALTDVLLAPALADEPSARQSYDNSQPLFLTQDFPGSSTRMPYEREHVSGEAQPSTTVGEEEASTRKKEKKKKKKRKEEKEADLEEEVVSSTTQPPDDDLTLRQDEPGSTEPKLHKRKKKKKKKERADWDNELTSTPEDFPPLPFQTQDTENYISSTRKSQTQDFPPLPFQTPDTEDKSVSTSMRTTAEGDITPWPEDMSSSHKNKKKRKRKKEIGSESEMNAGEGGDTSQNSLTPNSRTDEDRTESSHKKKKKRKKEIEPESEMNACEGGDDTSQSILASNRGTDDDKPDRSQKKKKKRKRETGSENELNTGEDEDISQNILMSDRGTDEYRVESAHKKKKKKKRKKEIDSENELNTGEGCDDASLNILASNRDTGEDKLESGHRKKKKRKKVNEFGSDVNTGEGDDAMSLIAETPDRLQSAQSSSRKKKKRKKVSESEVKTQSVEENTLQKPADSFQGEKVSQTDNTHSNEAQRKGLASSVHPSWIYGSELKTCSLTCYECQEEMPSRKKYIKHLSKVHNVMSYQCQRCGRPLLSKHSLKQHLKYACNRIAAIKFRKACKLCPLMYGDTDELARHMNSVHNIARGHKGLKRFECPICAKIFTRKETLRNHMVAACAKRKPDAAENKKPECLQCGRVYSSRQSLYYHRKTIHRGEVKTCEKCGKVFRWSTQYYIHKNERKCQN